MSSTERIGARQVRVGPGGQISARDVLDFVEALIDEKGWLKFDPAVGSQVSSDETGYTLHDAVGQFGTRLASDAVKSSTLGGGKDAFYTDPATGDVTYLRQEATRLIDQAIDETNFTPVGRHQKDQEFNDQAGSVDDVLNVVRRARDIYEEEVSSSATSRS